ncbi:MAG: hypothetical protein LRY40_04895, partial [Shewanella fodinae]|nr:hypothetical protein [Shewanella fodinae]
KPRLTVPGNSYVIDPGTARISRYSYRTKVQRLPDRTDFRRQVPISDKGVVVVLAQGSVSGCTRRMTLITARSLPIRKFCAPIWRQ